MRVRALDANGDMQFGASQADFLANTPAAVAQIVQTRLLLLLREWFLDTSDGTPWRTQVLGRGTSATYDTAIRGRILGTTGVVSLAAYASQLSGRSLSVQATINTAYGQAEVSVSL